MKVLITGGLGFVGSHVADYYASRNEEVTILDNLSRSNQYNLPDKISLTAPVSKSFLLPMSFKL